MAWNVLQTTFRLGGSDRPPKTQNEAEQQRWHPLSDCRHDKRFAGSRWIQHMDDDSVLPDKIMIYDANGQMAGMQSLIPSEDFVGKDCTDNKYYVKETINTRTIHGHIQFCVTTMYFRDPASICNGASGEDQLFQQIGKSFRKKNLVAIPKTFDEAKADSEHWHIDKYFPGMGHHTTSNVDRDNCKTLMPFQGLYAWLDGECRNIGFAATHCNTKTPAGKVWEKPNVLIGKMIMNNLTQCLEDLSSKSQITVMHVYLGGSTEYCT